MPYLSCFPVTIAQGNASTRQQSTKSRSHARADASSSDILSQSLAASTQHTNATQATQTAGQSDQHLNRYQPMKGREILGATILKTAQSIEGVVAGATTGAIVVAGGTAAAGLAVAGGATAAGVAVAVSPFVGAYFAGLSAYRDLAKPIYYKQKNNSKYIPHSLGLGGIHLMEFLGKTGVQIVKSPVTIPIKGYDLLKKVAKPIMFASIKVCDFLGHLSQQSEKFFSKHYKNSKAHTRKSNVFMHYGYLAIGSIVSGLGVTILGAPRYLAKGVAYAFNKSVELAAKKLTEISQAAWFQKLCHNEKLKSVQKVLAAFAGQIYHLGGSIATYIKNKYQLAKEAYDSWSDAKKTTYRNTRNQATNAANLNPAQLKKYHDEKAAKAAAKKAKQDAKALNPFASTILQEGIFSKINLTTVQNQNTLDENLKNKLKSILKLNSSEAAADISDSNIITNMQAYLSANTGFLYQGDHLKISQDLAAAVLEHVGHKVLAKEALNDTEIGLSIACKMQFANGRFNLIKAEKDWVYGHIQQASKTIQTSNNNADIQQAKTDLGIWIGLLQNTPSRFEFNEMVRDQANILNHIDPEFKNTFFDHRNLRGDIAALQGALKVAKTTGKKQEIHDKFKKMLGAYGLNPSDANIKLETDSLHKIAQKLSKYDTIPKSSTIKHKADRFKGEAAWQHEKNNRLLDSYLQQLEALKKPEVQKFLNNTPVIAKKTTAQTKQGSDYALHMGRKFLEKVLNERLQQNEVDTKASPIMNLYLQNRALHTKNDAAIQRTAQQIEYTAARQINLPLNSAGTTAAGAVLFQHAGGGLAFAATLAAAGFPALAFFSAFPVIGDIAINNPIFGSVGFLAGVMHGTIKHQKKSAYLNKVREENLLNSENATFDLYNNIPDAPTDSNNQNSLKLNPKSDEYAGVKQIRQGGLSQIGLTMRKLGSVLGPETIEFFVKKLPAFLHKKANDRRKAEASYIKGRIIPGLINHRIRAQEKRAQKSNKTYEQKNDKLIKAYEWLNKHFANPLDKSMDPLLLQAAVSKKSLKKLRLATQMLARYHHAHLNEPAQVELKKIYQKKLQDAFDKYLTTFDAENTEQTALQKLFLQKLSLDGLKLLKEALLSKNLEGAEDANQQKLELLERAIEIKEGADISGLIHINNPDNSIALEMPADILAQILKPEPWQKNVSDRIIGSGAALGINQVKNIIDLQVNYPVANQENLNNNLANLAIGESIQIITNPTKKVAITITKYKRSDDAQPVYLIYQPYKTRLGKIDVKALIASDLNLSNGSMIYKLAEDVAHDKHLYQAGSDIQFSLAV